MTKKAIEKHENVYPCRCESAFQDDRYGEGMRLFNPNKDGNKGLCTVCGRQ